MSILFPYIIPRVEAKSRFVFRDFGVQISAQTMTILAKVLVTFLSPSTTTLGYYVIRQKPLPPLSFQIYFLLRIRHYVLRSHEVVQR